MFTVKIYLLLIELINLSMAWLLYFPKLNIHKDCELPNLIIQIQITPLTQSVETVPLKELESLDHALPVMKNAQKNLALTSMINY